MDVFCDWFKGFGKTSASLSFNEPNPVTHRKFKENRSMGRMQAAGTARGPAGVRLKCFQATSGTVVGHASQAELGAVFWTGN
jgi:hypothetical protein